MKRTDLNKSPSFVMKLRSATARSSVPTLAHEVGILAKLRGGKCNERKSKGANVPNSVEIFPLDIHFAALFAYGRYTDEKASYEAYITDTLLEEPRFIYANSDYKAISNDVATLLLLRMVCITSFNSRKSISKGSF